MSLNVSWSDDDDSEGSEGVEDEEVVSNYVAFTAKTGCEGQNNEDVTTPKRQEIETDDGSESDEEISEGQLHETYKIMLDKWVMVCEVNKSLRKQVEKLEEENESLEKTVKENMNMLNVQEKNLKETEAELMAARSILKKLSSGTEKLDEILAVGRRSGDLHGLGYEGGASASKTVFVKGSVSTTTETNHAKKEYKVVCHYCGVSGHIRPRCYRFLHDLRMKNGISNSARVTRRKVETRSRNQKKKWVIKGEKALLVAHSSLRVSSEDVWYFDSGCSKHMTGDKRFLSDIHSCGEGLVTFGDGKKGRVLGKGNLEVDGCPKLKNVLLVDGLKANLISISQLCDQNLRVDFTKEACKVLNQENDQIMEGIRTFDNCYRLVNKLKCHKSSKDDLEVCINGLVISATGVYRK